ADDRFLIQGDTIKKFQLDSEHREALASIVVKLQRDPGPFVFVSADQAAAYFLCFELSAFQIGNIPNHTEDLVPHTHHSGLEPFITFSEVDVVLQDLRTTPVLRLGKAFSDLARQVGRHKITHVPSHKFLWRNN